MISKMKASERRKGYGLKRIVVSQHNYLALKKLGQAGDSFNDVITNLLLIQRNYQQEKDEEKKKQQRQQMIQLQQQQESSNDDSDNNNDITNFINQLYSPSRIDEVIEQDKRQIA